MLDRAVVARSNSFLRETLNQLASHTHVWYKINTVKQTSLELELRTLMCS